MSLISRALEEDAVSHDLTVLATISAGQEGKAHIIAKAAGRLSGIMVAQQVFDQVDSAINQQWYFQDGDQVQLGDRLCNLGGNLRSLLSAERTALNFIQHLSGIATATAAMVKAISGTPCKIVDTRKTTPGLRHLEKEAVRHGGGYNHRLNLASGMLIKENHIMAAGSVMAAVAACRSTHQSCWLEVECETLDEVAEAVHTKPDIILLDNMSPERVAQARLMVPSTVILEASGNITVETAHRYAQTGVDRLAVGAITHSAPILDLSMRVTKETR
ncbi:MAG: carboxylating nicotinate-nucleotide diphosphorylase [Mariprofundaceae bacterium]